MAIELSTRSALAYDLGSLRHIQEYDLGSQNILENRSRWMQLMMVLAFWVSGFLWHILEIMEPSMKIIRNIRTR